MCNTHIHERPQLGHSLLSGPRRAEHFARMHEACTLCFQASRPDASLLPALCSQGPGITADTSWGRANTHRRPSGILLSVSSHRPGDRTPPAQPRVLAPTESRTYSCGLRCAVWKPGFSRRQSPTPVPTVHAGPSFPPQAGQTPASNESKVFTIDTGSPSGWCRATREAPSADCKLSPLERRHQ